MLNWSPLFFNLLTLLNVLLLSLTLIQCCFCFFLGIPYRRGYLLYGPPGCGKSSFMYVHFSIPTLLLWLLLEHLNQVLLVFNVQVKIYTITESYIYLVIYSFFWWWHVLHSFSWDSSMYSHYTVLQDFGVYSAASTNLSWKHFNFVSPWPAITAISLHPFDITRLVSPLGDEQGEMACVSRMISDGKEFNRHILFLQFLSFCKKVRESCCRSYIIPTFLTKSMVCSCYLLVKH